MTACARVVICVALAACSSRTPTERERALARLPSEAQVVAAADGSALTPFRPVIDAARSHLPAELDCVLDAALTSETVAFAVAPRVGMTIVVITRAHVSRCEALSKIASDTFVATIGAGAVVEQRSESPLESPQWTRARPYLLRDPIAIAIERDDRRMLAVAQPEPLDAWLAIDGADSAAIERDVRAWLERQRTSVLASFAANLTVQVRGSQLLVDTSKLRADELALFVADVLSALEAPPRTSNAAIFTCPPPGISTALCTDGTRYDVRSVANTLRDLVAVDTTPVIAGGDVIGIRLSQDAPLILRRDDILLAIDSHRITSGEQVRELAKHARDRVTLAVRRDGTDVILELRE